MSSLGRHILVEFSGCKPEAMDDVSHIEESMTQAARDASATVIDSSFHHFSPYGVSGVVVIQESHLAIHTWPEYGYAAVDLFTCGDTVDPWISFDALKKAFGASNHSAIEMYRGSLSMLNRNDFRPESGGLKDGVDENAEPREFTRTLWFTDRDENQALSLRYEDKDLFSKKSDFQRVRVLNTSSYGRMLAIDNMIMCTERDEFHYHEMMTHPFIAQMGEVKNVLVIGGGDGGTVRELTRYEQIENITMVEIDEVVVNAAKEYLPGISSALNNPKVNLQIGDGIAFVEKQAKEAPGSYDLVIVDGSDPLGPAEGLFSDAFFKNCHEVLKDGGMVCTQAESPMFEAEAFVDVNRCFKEIFGVDNAQVALFFAPTYPSGMWSIQAATKGGARHPMTDVNYEAIESFAEENGLRYYNADVHRAAFALPTFVRKMLHQSK